MIAGRRIWVDGTDVPAENIPHDCNSAVDIKTGGDEGFGASLGLGLALSPYQENRRGMEKMGASSSSSFAKHRKPG